MMYYPSNFVREAHSRLSILAFMLCCAAAVGGFFERALLQLGLVKIHSAISSSMYHQVIVPIIFTISVILIRKSTCMESWSIYWAY